MAMTTETDVVKAYLYISEYMPFKSPFKTHDRVRFERLLDSDLFEFIHGVHGEEVPSFEDMDVAQLIDEGHLFLGKTASVHVLSEIRQIIYWVKIGIRRESVELVSRRIQGKSRIRIYPQIRRGEHGLITGDDCYRMVFSKWKASKQFLMESTNSPSVGLTPPADVIKLELYEHQKQGLKWMVDREELWADDVDELPPFWEEKNGAYVSEASHFITLKRPRKIRGGILADQSGMGKTCTLLSLIAYTTKHNDQLCHVAKKQRVIEQCTWRPTLVVCPRSVLATWKEQIEQCTWAGSFKGCIYIGKNRTSDPDFLRQHDLVLTTYDILTKKDSSSDILGQIEWWRAVLDDVHVLYIGLASYIHLKAERRWAVTGKHIHQDIENYDIYPIMAFLQGQFFCNFGCGDHSTADQWLQSEVLMGIFSLRRTLPVKPIENYLVVLSKDERDFYNAIKAVARDTCCKDGGHPSTQAAVLQLWKSCNSVTLCREPELLGKWVTALLKQNEIIFACSFCKDQYGDTVTTRCAHLFCKSCIMHGRIPTCPVCRGSTTMCDLSSSLGGSSVVEKMKSLMEKHSSSANMSSKVSALLNLLQKSTSDNPNRKSIVLSQFQKMLMLVAGVLSKAGFNVRCMEGKRKVKTVEEFRNAEPPAVLLTTYRALSNTPRRLDLPDAASNVYLMEPCWNVHFEEEALIRIHQLGKKEDVNVVRLVCKNSIEERVLKERQSFLADAREVTLTSADAMTLLGI